MVIFEKHTGGAVSVTAGASSYLVFQDKGVWKEGNSFKVFCNSDTGCVRFTLDQLDGANCAPPIDTTTAETAFKDICDNYL